MVINDLLHSLSSQAWFQEIHALVNLQSYKTIRLESFQSSDKFFIFFRLRYFYLTSLVFAIIILGFCLLLLLKLLDIFIFFISLFSSTFDLFFAKSLKFSFNDLSCNFPNFNFCYSEVSINLVCQSVHAILVIANIVVNAFTWWWKIPVFTISIIFSF